MPNTEQMSLTLGQETASQFEKARLIEIWCAEPVFFASREISDGYYTEGVLGNYALAYALGWVSSPYRLEGKSVHRPSYVEDLGRISQDSYILPAWPITGQAKFRFERFNALSDSYWYAMSANRVVVNRKALPEYRRLQKTKGQDKPKHSSFNPSNFPQTGQIRMIDRGNRFQSLVFGNRELPEYFRIGKFRSKVRLSVLAELSVKPLPEAEYTCTPLLNTADLPSDLRFTAFDLISIPPASLLKNLCFQGEAWQIGEFVIPAYLQFCGSRIPHGK